MARTTLPDFENAIHYLENNKFSQKHLDKNRDKFTGQLAIILSWLYQGKKVCDDNSRLWRQIKHTAKRINDIGDMLGIYIDREWAMDQDGEQLDTLVYFLPENRGVFIRRGWIIKRKYRWWYSTKYTDQKIIRAIELEKRKREAQREKK